MTTKLLCVRHGQSTDNVEDLLSAREPGCALSDHGRRQAADVAAILETHDVAHVYSSPLRRARETADAIAARRRLPVTVLDGLREIALGSLEGQKASTREVTNDPVFRGWIAGNDLSVRFRGGERGSSVVDRMRAALDAVAHRHRDQTVVAVSHSGAMLAALANICAAVPEGPLELPPNCGVVTLVRHEQWHCVEWVSSSAPARSSGIDLTV